MSASARQGTPQPQGRPGHAAVPLERGRAGGILAGLIAFTAGFAAAGVVVTAGLGGSPPYLVSITVGLVGIGLTGFFLHRGTVALPEAKLWSPVMLRAVVSALDLPVVPITASVYLLAAVGVVGNIVVPLLLRR